MRTIDPLPNFPVSSFNADAFLFDLVRLDGRDDVPRPFLHRHGYYHLLWIANARGQHLLDFETLEVRPHAVFFIAPGQMHAWNSDIAPTGYVLNFSAEFFLRIYPRPEDIPFFHLANAHPALYQGFARKALAFMLGWIARKPQASSVVDIESTAV